MSRKKERNENSHKEEHEIARYIEVKVKH